MHRTRRKFESHVQLVRNQLEEKPLAFRESLSADVVQDALRETQVEYRERVYTPWLTIWVFLTQVMSADHSCRFAVCQAVAYLSSQGKRVCSAATSTYCEARARLPESFYRYLFQRVGQQTAADAEARWRFHGREVKVVDGSTVTMADTKANQAEYPQIDQQQTGLGFPIARLLVVFSLSVGTVLDAAIRPYQGKGTGELAMFSELSEYFESGDIVLGDKGFCSYCHVAQLVARSIDVVVTMNQSRWPNFERVRSFSPRDVLYRWNKPNGKPNGLTTEDFRDLPDFIEVRIVTVIVETPGFRPEKLEIVTTLTDPAEFPEREIGELYRRRWMCELSIRDLKTTLQMDHLRCETPEMVRKEIFTHLLAYNLIRTRMAQAAYYLDLPPHRISFKGTLQTLQAFSGACTASTSEEIAVLIATIGYHQVGRQPGRSEPRAVKRRPKYPPLRSPRKKNSKTVTA